MLNKLKDKFATLQFWWAKRKLKDGIDFEVTFKEGEPTIRFLRGEYKDVEVQFGVMSMNEVPKTLDFTTYVVYNPHNAIVTKRKFNRLTSNLVRVVLCDLGVASSKVMNESRTHDFDEPSEEREFHEEVDPLLEARVSKRKSRKKTVRTDTDVHPEIQQPAKPKRPRARTTGTKRPK